MMNMIKSVFAFGLLSGAAQQAALLMYKPWPSYDVFWLGIVLNVLALAAAPILFGLVVGLVSRHLVAIYDEHLDELGSTPAVLAMAVFTVAATIGISL